MKQTRMIGWTVMGIGAAILLLSTKKGSALRSDLVDKSGDLMDKLKSNLSDTTETVMETLRKAPDMAKKSRKKAMEQATNMVD
jgi:gas vesicle protein